jgi:UDP-N-acetylmuramyl pentapeptide phosphotransferase/UDP-N-acetylglucosamine-1-phosphate transferase
MIAVTYSIIFLVLLLLELGYFRIADRYNIIDKPNARSSHSTIVLRGGGIIFALSTLVWVGLQGAHGDWGLVVSYLPFLCGLMLIAGVSFVDDVRSLPDSVRLVAQFAAMGLLFYNLGILHWDMWWAVVVALVVCVGATNVINFMDGINGITAGYSLAVLLPLLVMNRRVGFVADSLLGVVALGVVVFCLFNFRPKGRAKCFAGDVGSIGMAFILLFMLGRLIVATGDVTWLIFLLVYGVDGCLTICHRILLHENLGEAHRKHAYQLMANELRMGHITVSLIYMGLQLAVSLGFVFVCPDSEGAHWCYLLGALALLSVAYVLFKKKYYHLHEEYLASLAKTSVTQ